MRTLGRQTVVERRMTHFEPRQVPADRFEWLPHARRRSKRIERGVVDVVEHALDRRGGDVASVVASGVGDEQVAVGTGDRAGIERDVDAEALLAKRIWWLGQNRIASRAACVRP